MTNDAKHHFICVFAIYISSWVKYRVIYSASFLIGIFLMFSFGSYLYILGTSPLSGIWFSNIFSQTVGSLFILFIWDFTKQNILILMRFNISISIFPIMDYTFCVKFKNSFLVLDAEDFFLCSFLSSLGK